LLDAGADIESAESYFGISPLGEAACSGREDCVGVLLARGALVDGVIVSPSTALAYAASNGELELAPTLVRAGADVDRDSLSGLNTPLSLAEDPPPNTD
jgi:ankyrin repeat protein